MSAQVTTADNRIVCVSTRRLPRARLANGITIPLLEQPAKTVFTVTRAVSNELGTPAGCGTETTDRHGSPRGC